jgi:peroxin-12
MASAEEDEQLRPTYFELAAAESLVPSLKAALSYSLAVRLADCARAAAPAHWVRAVQVLAQRRPGLHRLLDHEDEAFAALMLLVVRLHGVSRCDATR